MSILQIFDTGSGYKLIDSEISENKLPSGTISIDLSASRNFTVTAIGSNTWSFINAPTSTRLALTTIFRVTLTNGGLGTQTWPANVTWINGSPPTLTSSGVNLLQFTSTDYGVSWIGQDLSIKQTITTIEVTDAELKSNIPLKSPRKLNTLRAFFKRPSGSLGDLGLTLQYSTNNGGTWTNWDNQRLSGTSGLSCSHGFWEFDITHEPIITSVNNSSWTYVSKVFPSHRGGGTPVYDFTNDFVISGSTKNLTLPTTTLFRLSGTTTLYGATLTS